MKLFLFMTASFPSIGDENEKIMNSQNDVIHNLILLGFWCLLSSEVADQNSHMFFHLGLNLISKFSHFSHWPKLHLRIVMLSLHWWCKEVRNTPRVEIPLKNWNHQDFLLLIIVDKLRSASSKEQLQDLKKKHKSKHIFKKKHATSKLFKGNFCQTSHSTPPNLEELTKDPTKKK